MAYYHCFSFQTVLKNQSNIFSSHFKSIDHKNSDTKNQILSFHQHNGRSKLRNFLFKFINFLIYLINVHLLNEILKFKREHLEIIKSSKINSNYLSDSKTKSKPKSSPFNIRSFFKLWPSILKNKLASYCFSNLTRRVLFKNDKLQNIIFLLFIFSNFTVSVSANLKITVQGDILLGGIFPVHQKGNYSDYFYL